VWKIGNNGKRKNQELPTETGRQGGGSHHGKIKKENKMKMRKLLVLSMAVAVCSIAVAGPDWTNGSGDGLWTTGANWTGGLAPATGGADNNPAIHGQAVGPTINADVGVVFNVWHGVFGTQPGALVMTTGGKLVSNEYTLGAQNDSYNDAVITMDGGWLQANKFKIGDSQSGRVDISGGVMTAYNAGNQLLVGATGQPWSRGKLNITGTGDVRADALLMNTGGVQTDSRILINDSGVLKIRGDQTGGGTDLMSYIGSGWIHTTDSGKWIDATYDATWNETVVTAIPEPATLGMVVLLGGGMLWIRKRLMI